MTAIDQHEDEARNGDEWRQRIERHSERPRHLRTLMPQQHHAHLLRQKLQQDARNHQQGNHLHQRKKAEAGGHQPQCHQGAVRNAVPRMDGGEKAEIVAVARGRVGYARVAEQQRKDRGEGRPHNQRGHQAAGYAAKGGVGDVGHQLQANRCAGGCVRGGLRHRGQRGQIHGHIKRCDKKH